MARTTIFLPDDLLREIEHVRAKINVSGVCQVALRREVARLQATPSSVEVPSDVLKRLRQEVRDFQDYWYDVGVQLGVQWAQQESYRNLRPYIHPSGRPPPNVMELLVGGMYTDPSAIRATSLDDYPALRLIYTADTEPDSFKDFDEDALAKGWLAGVRQFWETVQSQI